MSEQSDFQYYCPRRERTIYFDYYHLLDILPTASEEDIKKAYRKLALKYHPDKSLAEAKYVSKEKFKIISDAYATLIDPARRCLYNSFMNCMLMKRNLKKCDVQGVSQLMQSCKINELMNMLLFQNLGRCSMGNNNQSCGQQYSNNLWNFQNLNQKNYMPTNNQDQSNISWAYSSKLNSKSCNNIESIGKQQDSNTPEDVSSSKVKSYQEHQREGMGQEKSLDQQEQQQQNCFKTSKQQDNNDEVQDSRISDIKEKLNFITSCQDKSRVTSNKEEDNHIQNASNITLQCPNISLFPSASCSRTIQSDFPLENTFTSSNQSNSLLLDLASKFSFMNNINEQQISYSPESYSFLKGIIPTSSQQSQNQKENVSDSFRSSLNQSSQQPISLLQNDNQFNEPTNIEQEEAQLNLNSNLQLEQPQSERCKDISSSSPGKCKSLITKQKIKTQFKSYCKSIQIIHNIQKKKKIFSLIKTTKQ